jgi:hypothetical protein
VVESNGLNSVGKYDSWYSEQSTDVKKSLPTLQHIQDGFFSPDVKYYQDILDKFHKKVFTRGR